MRRRGPLERMGWVRCWQKPGADWDGKRRWGNDPSGL